MKKMLSVFMALTLIFICTVPAFAAVRIPDSTSYNGYFPDGTPIVSSTNPSMPIETSNTPRILIGYEYVPGYEDLRNETLIPEYRYIWGTSVDFPYGAEPFYELKVTKSVTSSTEWNIQGSLGTEFNIKSAKANISAEGGYRDTETASIFAEETWHCDYTEPGFYNLAWYQRAFHYDAYCGAYYITTDINDGKFTTIYVGSVTFPTSEVHLSITNTL